MCCVVTEANVYIMIQNVTMKEDWVRESSLQALGFENINWSQMAVEAESRAFTKVQKLNVIDFRVYEMGLKVGIQEV